MAGDIPFLIKSISEATIPDSQGNIEDVYQVQWTIPHVGTYTTNIPKSEFSAAEAQKIIQAQADEIGGLITNVMDTHASSTQG